MVPVVIQDRNPGNTPALDLLLSKIQGVTRSSDGWMGLCPHHADENASLHINVADDGRLLLHCFAGCPVESVMQSLDLTMSVLAGDARGSAAPKRAQTRGMNGRSTLGKRKNKSFPSVEAIAAAATHSKKGKVESTHI